jgi:hypothetical protein
MHTRQFSDVEASAHRCRCGGEVCAPRFGCLECGAACCAACAIPLESVAYCGRCAAALLGVPRILKSGPFELC